MFKFSQSISFKKLSELAKKPVDLTSTENLTPQRLEKYRAAACGYTLLYGTERITDEVMNTLEDLAKEANALFKMKQMHFGEILNVINGYPSENRRVLHMATRNFFSDTSESKATQEATNLAKKELDKLEAFTNELNQSQEFNEMIVIGIGGSDLGPRANYLALQYLNQNRRVHFISNVDPDDASSVLKNLDLKRSLVVVISKSGNTLETATNEAFVKSCFLKENLDPKKHFLAITGQGSPMDSPENYRQVFYIWDWVGGRYSSTSMVGGVILAFAYGFDVFMQFLKGAHAMDQTALQPSLSKNLPLLAALLGIWNRNFLKHPTLALIPYSQALLRYPAHVQQLDMESNGKHIDKEGKLVDFPTGPVIWGEVGTNSQHSFFQFLHQGTDVIPIEFIGFKKSQYQEDIEYQGSNCQEKLLANLFAQALALNMGKKDQNPNKTFLGNRPSHMLLATQLTPFHLGALLSFFENKVAFQGFIWGINSFDQEGVQLGKTLATKILDQFASKNGKAPKEPFPLAEVFIKQLDNLS